MRFSPTASEALLWAAIRGNRLHVSFRRQVPVGAFIVDFLAPARKLVVEVDGGYHARREVADARKDRTLARLGFRVLRLEAELVLHNLPEALARIRAALAAAE
jgi:very-short-patch-repair endonuclease